MKSCLGILLVFFTFVAVLGGGALIWYLSNTAEFSRKGLTEGTPAPGIKSGTTPKGAAIPKATVVTPAAPPKAHPVR